MSITDVVGRVDGERLYKHVFRFEGARHPIDAPEELNEAADYIHSEFEQYGLAVREQEFKVEGFDGTFRNVEGLIDDEGGPELLVVSHYDTVADCPGADDNGSAVAVMLEAARVLAQAGNIRNVRFVSFSLEELNPARLLRSRRIAQTLELIDKRLRYTNVHTHKVMKRFFELQHKGYASGKNPAEALAEARGQLEGQMSESEKKYALELEEMAKGLTLASWPGMTSVVGSSYWVDESLRAKKEVLGVLCFDTVGYTSEKEHSQFLPKGIDPRMFQTFNVKDTSVGDFLGIIGSANAERLFQSYCAQCRLDSVSLPYAGILVPFDFEVIAQMMFDLLRSDHAPFWRAGIPVVFLTDTAEFRYPYYHTQADTIDKLDFDFLTKVCKATVATAVDLASK